MPSPERDEGRAASGRPFPIDSPIEQGVFSVYGVNTIDEALEILTGREVRERRSSDDTFPEQAIYGKVARRLRDMTRIVRDRVD